jgi:hypothetical protein
MFICTGTDIEVQERFERMRRRDVRDKKDTKRPLHEIIKPASKNHRLCRSLILLMD